MSDLPATERRDPRSTRLDELATAEVVALMDDEEATALAAVPRRPSGLGPRRRCRGSAFTSGGTVAYVGAGSGGHLALLDAAEVSATFGVEAVRYRAFIATSSFDGPAVVTASEDDADAGVDAVDRAGLGPGDVVVGLAASGSTTFVVAAVEHARRRGCTTVGIANNPGTRLLEVAEIEVLLDTGPEVLTGSTRLKAGTAQKLALNRISTAAMVAAGRVVSNLMVEIRPTPQKLHERCIWTVQELAGVDRDDAVDRLERNGWSVRAAAGEGSRPAPSGPTD